MEISNLILFDTRLTATEKIVYIYFCIKTKYEFCRVKTFESCTALNLSERTFRKSVNTLIDCSLLARKVEKRLNYYRANKYKKLNNNAEL